MKIALLAAALALPACSADSAPRAAAPAARRQPTHAAAPTAPAARCGDGPILFETVSQGVGADGNREVSYQLFSATIDDPCGPLPDASIIELGRLFSRMTAKGAPDMPA